MASPSPTFLVGVDFSENGRATLDAAILLAQDLRADLVLLHAFPRRLGISPAAGDEAQKVIAQYRAELEADEAVGLSVEWAAKAREAGIHVETIARDGPPAVAILEEAEARAVTMIIVGTHGRTGLKKLVMGSVAEEVVRQAKRPVLVVPLAK